MSSIALPTSGRPRVLPAGLNAIFVVHASSFKERGKLIQAQMDDAGLPFEFILDFDISMITEALKQRLFAKSELSPAQQSCAAKHWHAHTLIFERRLSRALVLEDDVILSRDFLPTLVRLLREDLLFEHPHVTFLGCGGHDYVPFHQVNPAQLLYRRNQGKFADSYIVSLEAAERRLDWINLNGIPIPIDHLFEKIDRELGNAMYWLEPPVVEQGSHNGTFDSALFRSHSLWFQALQYRWKKLWRRRQHIIFGKSKGND